MRNATLRLVAVVDDDQLDLLSLGCAHQALVHFARERGVLALRRVSDAVAAALVHLADEPVEIFAHLLHEAAMVQRVEQPEAHALAEGGPLDDIAQPQGLARALESGQNLRRVDQ